MRKICVNAITGKEVLAKDIYSGNNQLLLPAGTPLKAEYSSHLLRLNIYNIYVQDEISIGVNTEGLSEITMYDSCMQQVRDTLGRFTYRGRTHQSQINQVTEEIIRDVCLQVEVIYNIAGVRQKSEELYCHSLNCLLYTSPSPRDLSTSRMPSSA